MLIEWATMSSNFVPWKSPTFPFPHSHSPVSPWSTSIPNPSNSPFPPSSSLNSLYLTSSALLPLQLISYLLPITKIANHLTIIFYMLLTSPDPLPHYSRYKLSTHLPTIQPSPSPTPTTHPPPYSPPTTSQPHPSPPIMSHLPIYQRLPSTDYTVPFHNFPSLNFQPYPYIANNMLPISHPSHIFLHNPSISMTQHLNNSPPPHPIYNNSLPMIHPIQSKTPSLPSHKPITPSPISLIIKL